MLTIPIFPMIQKYARALRDQDQVEYFLKEILELDYAQLDNEIFYKIIQGEQGSNDNDRYHQTLNDTRFRDRNYKDDNSRWELRKQIITELMTIPRLDNDDDIRLEKGGGLPQSGIKKDSQAYLIIGLPASGKSSIAAIIAEKYGAIIADADFAKRKLPEFDKYAWGASAVHEESRQIVNGFLDNPRRILSVYETASQLKYNIVIPKIGQDVESILTMCNSLKEKGYKVHLTLISLYRKEATIRALHRFNETGRYVPLGLIFDGYSNDPCLSYYRLKNMMPDVISSFGAISTDVPKGEPYKLIDVNGDNPARLFQAQQLLKE